MGRGGQRKRGHTYLHRLWKRATIGKPTGIKGTEVTPAPVINHISFPRTPVGTHQCILEGLKERMIERMTMIETDNKGVLMVMMLPHHEFVAAFLLTLLWPYHPGSLLLRHSFSSIQNNHWDIMLTACWELLLTLALYLLKQILFTRIPPGKNYCYCSFNS